MRRAKKASADARASHWPGQEISPDPHPSATATICLPERAVSSWRRLGIRLGASFAILLGTVLLVYVDRAGYSDPNGDGMSLIDVVYYVTVTLSTTGYGDITPVTDSARLVNAFVITPARIVFLALLIGTTLEVLAIQGRTELRIAAWRRRLKHHAVVVGFGVKGRTASDTLVSNGRRRDQIVIVDPSDAARDEALGRGHAVVSGDATGRDVLLRAGVRSAERIIVCTSDDDATMLVTLAARQLNPGVHIAATVGDRRNVPLLRESGANLVIVLADSAAGMLDTSATSPHFGAVLGELMLSGEDVEIAEREAAESEEGRHYRDLGDRVIGMVRDGEVHYTMDGAVAPEIEPGDRLIVVRPAEPIDGADRGIEPHR